MSQPEATPRRDAPSPEPSPEEDRVRVGSGPTSLAGAHLEEDPYIGVRVSHTLKPSGPVPAEEASLAGQDIDSGEMNAIEQAAEAAAPIQDIRITPDEPSVWEAIGERKE